MLLLIKCGKFLSLMCSAFFVCFFLCSLLRQSIFIKITELGAGRVGGSGGIDGLKLTKIKKLFFV